MDWKKYNPFEQYIIIEDIVGLCMMFEKNQSAVGEFKLDAGGGGFVYSLFVTWKRADPYNQELLVDIMKIIIDKYKIDKKTEEIKKKYSTAAKFSEDYLRENGIKL